MEKLKKYIPEKTEFPYPLKGGECETKYGFGEKMKYEGLLQTVHLPGLECLHGRFVIAIRSNEQPTKLLEKLDITIETNNRFVKSGLKYNFYTSYFEYDEIENKILTEDDYEYGFIVSYDYDNPPGWAIGMDELQKTVTILNLENPGHSVYMVDANLYKYRARVKSIGSKLLTFKQDNYIVKDGDGSIYLTDNYDLATKFSPYSMELFTERIKKERNLNIDITWVRESFSTKGIDK